MPATAVKKHADTTELTEKWKGREIPHFKVFEVRAVNFKPHPFCIGSQHFPGPHEGPYLKPEKAPCAFRDCGRPFHEHTHDTVLILELTESISKKLVQDALKPICEEIEADGIDGFAFQRSSDGFDFTD